MKCYRTLLPAMLCRGREASALVAAVTTALGLRCPLLRRVGRLLPATVATSTGRTVEAHLRTIAGRRLGSWSRVVTLLAVLRCCAGISIATVTCDEIIRMLLTAVLWKVGVGRAREAWCLGALRTVGLVGIKALRVGCLILAPLERAKFSQRQVPRHDEC